ncbi:TPA: winged helix-turn-helix transcriptional regulator [Candidatus Woesearchaeota archaeon]|nr:winged helix-turn-helix transcriptional regulator [Candidatus Woesearchaeota archaeon]HIH32537.1 winged helix-turn-helix transcriptional regulator [Candidatus Woesearchaeota archaeon]HIH55087.1 winged helix-turn-helix transcriptional regulator [Candidatus Woesearchaeota archaeon]HIJ01720.1 winged helix-turn-helix transcriptional regulator [Candidatus Woesearchaeota archaeon]HIJ13240.1 winged helix-turn-helix transcriptional regulator [Candidatus Woesearchaeota archaeon]
MKVKNIILLTALTLIALIMINHGYAASIHGTVYDIILEPESDIKLQINTLPNQVFVSKEGQYVFNVPVGNYTVIAETMDGYAAEGIIVTDDTGDYVIDIILEPILTDIESPELNNKEIITNNLDEEYLDESTSAGSSFINIVIGFVLIVLLTILIISLFILREYSFVDKVLRKHKIVFKDHEIKKQHPEQVEVFKEKEIVKELAKETKETSEPEAKEEKILEGYGLDILNIVKKNSPMTQRELRKQIPLSEAKISLIVAELEHDGKIKKIKKGRGNILTFIKD